MRLLHASTFKLATFFDENVPPYVILSHTWGDSEVTLQEVELEETIAVLQSLKSDSSKSKFKKGTKTVKEGYCKLVGCALQAEQDGFDYIWIDTCCIDKTNNTELSEAINSMYHWYKDQLCYAYLTDVPSDNHISLGIDSAFYKSRWYTRGWTLQELIAPHSVKFFDSSWQFMGTRSELSNIISKRTNIDRDVLDSKGTDIQLCSIAKRMSWASRRQTTRIEDTAYCLMGLFNVNMPLLYGERQRAFIRLQEEIMKAYDDESLFAWKLPDIGDARLQGLLADSPAYFADSKNIVPLPRSGNTPPYTMTNRGISITLPMHGSYEKPLAVLSCRDATDARGPLGVFLLRNEKGSYHRTRAHELIVPSTMKLEINHASRLEGLDRHIYVQQYLTVPKPATGFSYRFHINTLPSELTREGIVCVVLSHAVASWDNVSRELGSSRDLAGAVFLGRNGGSGVVLLIGVDKSLHARCAFSPDTYEYNNMSRIMILLDMRRNDRLSSGQWDQWIVKQKEFDRQVIFEFQTTKLFGKETVFGLMVKPRLSTVVIEGEMMFSLDFDTSQLNAADIKARVMFGRVGSPLKLPYLATSQEFEDARGEPQT